MKLATLKDGSRDGQLVVVSRDLQRYTPAGTVTGTLQAALDDWAGRAPGLRALADELEIGRVKGEPFDPARAMAPLPRAYQWADGSAYLNHVALVRRSRGDVVPESFHTDPLMYQGGSDSFLGPCDPVPLADEAWGIDFEAEIAAITCDVPMGAARETAAGRIVLLMLVNDVSLRNVAADELRKGFGFFQAKPSSAFSPVAATPDELGEAWDGGKVHLPLLSHVNGEMFGRPEAGEEMTFDFPALIAHAARTRPLGAGTIVGSGTVSTGLDGGPGLPVSEGGAGYSCIVERRVVETLNEGEATTPFLRFGDRVRIEMLDGNGDSVFGAIDQEIATYKSPDGR